MLKSLNLAKIYLLIVLLFISFNTETSVSKEIFILKSITLQASQEQVWSALTNEGDLSQWWNQGVKLEPYLGGLFYEPWGNNQLATGTVKNLALLNFIEFTWREKYWQTSEVTLCRFSLKEVNGSTLLQVKHSGWNTFKSSDDRKKMIKGFESGWDFLLPKLKKFLDHN